MSGFHRVPPSVPPSLPITNTKPVRRSPCSRLLSASNSGRSSVRPSMYINMIERCRRRHVVELSYSSSYDETPPPLVARQSVTRLLLGARTNQAQAPNDSRAVFNMKPTRLITKFSSQIMPNYTNTISSRGREVCLSAVSPGLMHPFSVLKRVSALCVKDTSNS